MPAPEPPAVAKQDEALLSGHLGHLSDQQEKALEDFKSRVCGADVDGKKSAKEGSDSMHDDVTYLYVG